MIIKSAVPYSIKEYMFMVARLQEIRKNVYSYLSEKGIDIIICPGFGLPPFLHGQAKVLFH